jgi:hypothetical protein
MTSMFVKQQGIQHGYGDVAYKSSSKAFDFGVLKTHQ